MKKIFMTLVAAAMTISMNAQVYVGGGVGVSSESGDGIEDVTTYKFVPEIGYNFNEDWAAGMAFGWEGMNEGGPKSFSIAPYVRYTIFTGKVVNAFLDGSVGFTHKYNAGFDDDLLSIGLKPGIAVKLNNKLSFVSHIGFIGYQQLKNNQSKNKVNSWGIDVDGNNIVLGLYYNI